MSKIIVHINAASLSLSNSFNFSKPKFQNLGFTQIVRTWKRPWSTSSNIVSFFNIRLRSVDHMSKNPTLESPLEPSRNSILHSAHSIYIRRFNQARTCNCDCYLLDPMDRNKSSKKRAVSILNWPVKCTEKNRNVLHEMETNHLKKDRKKYYCYYINQINV